MADLCYTYLMTTIEWAAGLFEGEGSFFVNTIRKSGKTYNYPCAALKMTDEDVVRRFHKVIGFGKVWFNKSKVWNWKNTWMWRCHGHEETSKVFEMLRPFLFPRRVKAGIETLSVPEVPVRDKKGHGTHTKYCGGCRCTRCKKAHREYARSRRNALVSER